MGRYISTFSPHPPKGNSSKSIKFRFLYCILSTVTGLESFEEKFEDGEISKGGWLTEIVNDFMRYKEEIEDQEESLTRCELLLISEGFNAIYHGVTGDPIPLLFKTKK